MSYNLRFKQEALAEWRKLDRTISEALKRKLAQRLENPVVPADRLQGHPHRFKIKLRDAGFRLVYEVREAERAVVVIAIGKREKGSVYRKARLR